MMSLRNNNLYQLHILDYWYWLRIMLYHAATRAAWPTTQSGLAQLTLAAHDNGPVPMFIYEA